MQKRLLVLAIALLGLSITAHAEVTKHAVNGTYGCRRAFGFGVYNAAANKTAICWNGESMSIYAREFDHATQQWSEPVKACGLDFTDTWDYHNYPCITIAPDGHYLIFYFKHVESSFLVMSPGPNKIAGAWSHKKLSDDKCAYPMPVVVGDTAYLFYSSKLASSHRPYRMTKSTDNGATWSEPITLIDTGNKQPEQYDEVYLHGFRVKHGIEGEPDRILLGWELAGGPNGHNKGGYGNFFASFNCQNQKMFTAGGKDLGDTVDLHEMFSDCIINDAKDPTSRLFEYTTFPEVLPDGSACVLYNLRRKAFIAQWEDYAWKTTEINIPGHVSDYQRTSKGTYVLLTGGNRNTTVWESQNGVTGWEKQSVTELPDENGSNSTAKGFIEDFKADVQWMAATFDRDNFKEDYSGQWPVFTFGLQDKSQISESGAESRAANRAP